MSIVSALSQTGTPVFPASGKPSPLANAVQIPTFSLDIEQTLNIGAQSSGAGAGKVTFNPLVIKRPVDQTSPVLFRDCASGVTFKTLTVNVVGSNPAVNIPLTYTFSLVAVQTIAYDSGDGSSAPMETVSFQYGALEIDYTAQKADGTPGTTVAAGWDRVKNIGCLGSACSPV
jgi:type VI secretion system secreted protein Hcp